MNWLQVENKWQQFRGFAKKSFKKLTDSDLNAIGGRRGDLIRRLQESYGMSPADAAKCADQWLRLSQDAETVDMRPRAYTAASSRFV